MDRIASPVPEQDALNSYATLQASRLRTDGGGLIEVGAGEHRGGVHAGPAPEHDALEAGVAVQALLRLLVGLLVVAVLRLGPLRLVDGQVAACTCVPLSCAAQLSFTARHMRDEPRHTVQALGTSLCFSTVR